MNEQVNKASAILVLLLSAATCVADGKFYARERVPPDIPYQRALILYHDGKETLVLQSNFETSDVSSANAAMGWVLPAPSVPELASMTAPEAENLFSRLGAVSQPRVTRRGDALWGTLLAVAVAGCVVLFLLYELSIFAPRLGSLGRRRALLARLTFCCLLLAVVIALVRPYPVWPRAIPRVEVLWSEQVGVYDAKVIKATNSADLIAWLTENGFQFTASDTPVLDRYIQRGWCFVVAEVRADLEADVADGLDGLIDPIILRFDTTSPVYPLALTSTIGIDTEVLIYFLADKKMSCGDRMEIHFAGDLDADGLQRRSAESAEHFRPWETSLDYLCKFKGRLSPEQMQTDLVFVPASDNKAYRRHITK
ncbi:MAG: hypothetical protein CMJ49_10435 [Planctomycetaceae bacterium]|nr:hypothetical protein [Planctomycetaceae bacterium]